MSGFRLKLLVYENFAPARSCLIFFARPNGFKKLQRPRYEPEPEITRSEPEILRPVPSLRSIEFNKRFGPKIMLPGQWSGISETNLFARTTQKHFSGFHFEELQNAPLGTFLASTDEPLEGSTSVNSSKLSSVFIFFRVEIKTSNLGSEIETFR